MNRWFKYIIVSAVMAFSIFFLVYYQKGEYNYAVFPAVFITNTFIYFDKKKQKSTLNKVLFIINIFYFQNCHQFFLSSIFSDNNNWFLFCSLSNNFCD